MPGLLLRDTVLVGSGSMVCQVLGTLTALALRMLLDPSLMGVWSGLKVFLGYGNFAGLGASKAAAREIAYETARGNREAAERATNVAFTLNSITSGLYLVGLLAAAVWMGFTATGPFAPYWSAGLATIAVLAFLSRYSTFLITVLRSRQEFGRTTRLALFEAALTMVATVSAVWLWGLYGLFAATVAVMLAGIGFLHAGGRLRMRFHWDWPEAKRLVVIGAPILAGGLTLTLLRSVDKVMILAYLPDGEHALGCYSIGLMAAGALNSLANVLGIVSYPRYQVRYGETGVAREVAGLATRLTEASAFVLSVLLALTAVVVPPVLAWLLPAYREGLPAMVMLLPGVLLLCLAQPACHYLITVGKQHHIAPVVLAAVGVAVAANHLALSSGGGITGVAVASTASYAFYCVLLSAVAYRSVLSPRCLLGLVLRCLAPMLLAAASYVLWREVADRGVASLGEASIATVGAAALLTGWASLWRRGREWRAWLWKQ